MSSSKEIVDSSGTVSRRNFISRAGAAALLGAGGYTLGEFMKIPSVSGTTGDIDPVAYIIYIDASQTAYALNGTTGNIDKSCLDPAVVINYAINALAGVGGTILIKAGVYTMASTAPPPITGPFDNNCITIDQKSGIRLVGESKQGTILTVNNANSYCSLIGI